MTKNMGVPHDWKESFRLERSYSEGNDNVLSLNTFDNEEFSPHASLDSSNEDGWNHLDCGIEVCRG
jgi:hypothetical protein